MSERKKKPTLIAVDEEFAQLLKEIKMQLEHELGVEIPLTSLTRKLSKELRELLKKKKKNDVNINLKLFK